MSAFPLAEIFGYLPEELRVITVDGLPDRPKITVEKLDGTVYKHVLSESWSILIREAIKQSRALSKSSA